jgi:hypothetical protein
LLARLWLQIKKIKIGEFEAEIEPGEVRRITEEVQRSLPSTPADAATTTRSVTLVSAIKNLADTDPILALAKLRIELESRLRRLATELGPSAANVRNRSLARLIGTLTAAEVIDGSFGAALRDVIAICNRAVHGEDIRSVDAKQIVDTGSELLEALEQIVRDQTPADPIETTIITPAERDAYQGGWYRVTTIVPLVENPEQRLYLMDQPQLDSFLDGYSEYAEFLIKVERVP